MASDNDQAGKSQSTPKHHLEEDVTLADGRVVRVTGAYAVQFRKDPEATLQVIEEDMRRRDDREAARKGQSA